MDPPSDISELEFKLKVIRSYSSHEHLLLNIVSQTQRRGEGVMLHSTVATLSGNTPGHSLWQHSFDILSGNSLGQHSVAMLPCNTLQHSLVTLSAGISTGLAGRAWASHTRKVKTKQKHNENDTNAFMVLSSALGQITFFPVSFPLFLS